MNNSSQRHIEVYAHWLGLPEPTLMGVLSAAFSRGKEIFSFSYQETWLKGNQASVLDPSLQLFSGPQYAPQAQENFGIFLDSSPDRWGRFLMNRRAIQLAREEGRTPQKLFESDYLLGVYDEHRMGALRFRLDPKDPFLDSDRRYASPPWASLRELEQASLGIEKDDAEDNPAYSKWLQMLIAPGGSLGGARPKASVTDEKQHPWIAKFPSSQDETDIGAWEMVVYKLAVKAGIVMAEARAQKFNNRHHTFMSRRFDRDDFGNRIQFTSAATLLQRLDGEDASEVASYLELAEFIMRQGANPAQDLEQLWRRIVFYICVSNVDDHLRNHGFLLCPRGWLLSPAYDINPALNAAGLKLNISGSDNSLDLNLAKEVADYFRVTPKKTRKIIEEVVKAVGDWRVEANALGISASDQERMKSAFITG